MIASPEPRKKPRQAAVLIVRRQRGRSLGGAHLQGGHGHGGHLELKWRGVKGGTVRVECAVTSVGGFEDKSKAIPIRKNSHLLRSPNRSMPPRTNLVWIADGKR
jgi:hypothetical protein